MLVEAEATVLVSLYSMNPETHERKAQIPCRISCPTMKPNYKDCLDVLTYARSLRMDAQTDFIIMGKMDCDTSNLKCLHCPDRNYCSVCMCRNFNETGDMFTPAQHFCDVAKLNHEVVDEVQTKRSAMNV